MKKHIVIVCNGDDYDEKKIRDYCKDCDYIICANGGLKTLDRFSITPNLIIGDMDSVDNDLLLKYKTIQKESFPVEKDLTDSELAIKKAILLKATKISILAATGTYIDHSIANIINLARNYNNKTEMKIITKNSEIFPIIKEKTISNAIGRRFSFFPIERVISVSMQGCKYFFKKGSNLLPTDYSVSNVITENKAKIKIKKGMLICILFDKMYK